MTTGPGSPVKEVFGFATYGSLGDANFGYPSWNFDLLSTVAFYGIHVQYDGVLVADGGWAVWDSSTLAGLVSTAHAHGTKVVVTIRGPSNPIEFCDALYNGLTTANQIINQVVAKGVDGVNIDYESQRVDCHPTNPGFVPQTDQALITAFAKQMRTSLDAVRPARHYYLSIDTYSASASGTDGLFDIGAISPYVDSFFVMAYDMDWENWVYPPLSCSSGTLGMKCMSPGSPLANYYYNDSLSMSQYSALVGPGKVILGQPYYGTVACVSSPVEHATPTAYLTAVSYLDAADVSSSLDVSPGTFVAHRGDVNDPNGLDRWDTWYDRQLGCWREMYWPDAVQLGTRYDLVNQLNLRGVGFWTLNYGGGAAELWDSLQGHFVTCTGATLSASPSQPQAIGPVVTLTATVGNCPTPVYQFWVKLPGGTTWLIAQPYSTSPTLTWDTASKPLGVYQFVVWARDVRGTGVMAGSLGRLDTLAALNYSLTAATPAPCTSVTTSVTPAAPLLSGTTITLSETAACTSTRYQFWILFPGSSTWLLAQAYSPSSTLTWNTLGLAPGDYRFAVWARDGTSYGTSRNVLGTWDAYSMVTVTLTTNPCPSVAASAAPASPQLSGTLITVTAAASGCPKPNYQFWLLAPGSSTWLVAKPYSSDATFGWNTAGLAAGNYVVAVWTRDTSSLGTHSGALGAYDSLTSFSFQVASQPCKTASAQSSPAGTAAAGTAVAITATSTGCPSPLYQVWMLPPGSQNWLIAQFYAGSATFNWATAGWARGSYLFIVWARDASSLGTSGNPLGRWDAYAQFSYTLT